MSQIIISYLTNDTQLTAVQLGTYLSEHFGNHAVTLGVKNLVQVGEDYRETVDTHIRKSEILLVVIGQRWLEGGWVTDDENLDRIAMTAAFAYRKRVLPVLVDGATMPTPEQLPEALAPLLRRNPIELTDQTFNNVAGKLVRSLEDFIPPYYPDPAPVSAGAGSVFHTSKRDVSAASEAPYELADTGVRLAAYLIDTIILYIILTVVGFVVGAIFGSALTARTYTALEAAQSNLAMLSFILGLAVNFVYFTVFWTRSGQTPGKEIMRIKVIHREGRLLTTGESISRIVGYYLGGLALGLGFIWILFDDKKRGWHDHMAGSLVVKTEKKKR